MTPVAPTNAFPSLQEAKLHLLAKYSQNTPSVHSKTELTYSTAPVEDEEYSEDEVLVPLNTNEDDDESTVVSTASKRLQTNDHLMLERPVYSHMRRRSAARTPADMEINIPGSSGSYGRRQSLKRLSGHFNVSEDDMISILSAAVDDDEASILSNMVDTDDQDMDDAILSQAIDASCKRAAMMFGVAEVDNRAPKGGNNSRRSFVGRRSRRASGRRPSYLRRSSANSTRQSFSSVSDASLGNFFLSPSPTGSMGRPTLTKTASCRLLQVSNLPKALPSKPVSCDDMMVGRKKEQSMHSSWHSSRSSFISDNSGKRALDELSRLLSESNAISMSAPGASRRRRVSVRRSFAQKLMYDDGADTSVGSSSGSLHNRRRSSIRRRASASSGGSRRSFTEKFLYEDDGDFSVGCGSASLQRRRSQRSSISANTGSQSSMQRAIMEAAAAFVDDDDDIEKEVMRRSSHHSMRLPSTIIDDSDCDESSDDESQ